MKLSIASAFFFIAITVPAFSQSASDLLVLDPPKPYNFKGPNNDLYEEFHRRNNAILLAPTKGSTQADKAVEQLAAQTKLLKEQNSILDAQLLIMQRDASKTLTKRP